MNSIKYHPYIRIYMERMTVSEAKQLVRMYPDRFHYVKTYFRTSSGGQKIRVLGHASYHPGMG